MNNCTIKLLEYFFSDINAYRTQGLYNTLALSTILLFLLLMLYKMFSIILHLAIVNVM